MTPTTSLPTRGFDTRRCDSQEIHLLKDLAAPVIAQPTSTGAAVGEIAATAVAAFSDLRRFLDEGLLLQLWPSLWLPAPVKTLWQERFRQLRSTAAA
jgi:hypothetical protein